MRIASDVIDGPIRTAVRDSSLDDIDWACAQLTPRDLSLLERLEHERRVRVELGLVDAAAGLAEAMLIIWHTAITPDVCIGTNR
jgi:hypothetical protein